VIVIAAAFISGGAMGAAGTLFAQWILRGVDSARPDRGRRRVDPIERDLLREEVAELHKHLRNMDARLDFTERLLDGGLPLAPPPERMPAPELRQEESEAAPESATAPDSSGGDTDRTT